MKKILEIKNVSLTYQTMQDEIEAIKDLTFHLNEGDILLFDEEVGYQVPRVPMSTLKDALTDIEALQDFDKEV